MSISIKSQKIRLQLAKQEQLSQLLKLLPYLSSNMHSVRAAMPSVEKAIQIFQQMKQQKVRIIIALKEDIILGSCVLIIIPNFTNRGQPWALIENVVVDPHYRNQGIGRALIEFALKTAQKQKCYKVQLVSGPKQEQIRFYQKMGFDNTHCTGFKKYF